jgi:hypothetical protein
VQLDTIYGCAVVLLHTGAVTLRSQTLLDEAEAQGSLTAPEIAGILNERELPVTYETESSVGPE